MGKRNLFSKLLSKLPGAKQVPVEAARSETPTLKLMFFIVDWSQAHVVSDVFVDGNVRFHFVTKGMGTANNEILDLLGIGAGDKAVVVCLEQAVGVSVLMKEVRNRLRRDSPGAGIAFTIPLSAINDPVLLLFKQSIHKNEKVAEELGLMSRGEGAGMADKSSRDAVAHDTITHDLIISIVNQGYSDEFMNTAREAGASGGTVINARGQAHEGAVKFFGI